MKTRNTLHFTSDGTHIYWLYAVAPPPVVAADKDKEKNKQEQVYLETLIVKVLMTRFPKKCSLKCGHLNIRRHAHAHTHTHTHTCTHTRAHIHTYTHTLLTMASICIYATPEIRTPL